MTKAEKFCGASLDQFSDEALLETLAAMEMVVDNSEASCDIKFDAFATYGKVSIELDKRGH